MNEKKRCKKCNSIYSLGKKKCDECGGKEWVSALYSREEVFKQFPNIPHRGLWYEIIDFSDDDASYSNDWGFYGFLDGNMIYNSGNIASKIRQAGEAARKWKAQEMESKNKAQLERLHQRTERSLR